MSPILIGKLLGGVALAAALTFATVDWRSARQARGELKICVAAAKDASKPLDGCHAALFAAITAARAAASCEAAIKASDLYAERASCGEAVKRRGAELTVSLADLDDTRRQLADAERRTVAAISRAEARGATQARMKANAEAQIARLPATAGGLLHCDADCLRRLSASAER